MLDLHAAVPPTLLAFVVFVGILVAVLGVRHAWRGLDAATRLVQTQYHVVSDAYFEQMGREVGGQDKARRVAGMVEAVKARGYVLRKGHAVWMLRVLDGNASEAAVPSFEPPAGLPYDVRLDPQVPAIARYMELTMRGDLVEAHRTIETAARAGSPMAMSFLGAGLVHDKFPGTHQPREGIDWLERAARESNDHQGAAELGELYLEGGIVPQDVARGLALLERAAATADPDSPVRWTLARVLRLGLHGLQADPERALAHVLPGAPKWRKVAHRLGIAQFGWLDRMLEMREAIRVEVAAKSPLELQQMLRRQTRHDRDA